MLKDNLNVTVVDPVGLGNEKLENIRKYNIAPTSYAPVLLQEDATNVIRYMKFGLIPYWNNNISQVEQAAASYKTINAKKETLLESRLWSFYCAKHSYRCAIPIQGYFEWQKMKDSTKIPYYILPRKRDRILYLAGLYSKTFVDFPHSSPADGTSAKTKNRKDSVYSFVIITTNATEYAQSTELKEIHPRMPMMLKPNTKEWDQWLSPQETITTFEELEKVLTPKNIPNNLMWYEVSKDVNYVRNDTSQLIYPVEKSPKKQDILDMIKSKTETDMQSPKKKMDVLNDNDSVSEEKKQFLGKNEEDQDIKTENRSDDEHRNKKAYSKSKSPNNNKNKSKISKKRALQTTEDNSDNINKKNKNIKPEDDDDLVITQVSPLKRKDNLLLALLSGKQTPPTRKHPKRRRSNK